MRRRGPLVLALIVVLGFTVRTPAAADSADAFSIGPGPASISSDESAVQADPNAGTEHALILLEESECNEDLPSGSESTYHLRAKILGNKGRDLADVAIPTMKGSKLKRWWGRAIAPDGT